MRLFFIRCFASRTPTQTFQVLTTVAFVLSTSIVYNAQKAYCARMARGLFPCPRTHGNVHACTFQTVFHSTPSAVVHLRPFPRLYFYETLYYDYYYFYSLQHKQYESSLATFSRNNRVDEISQHFFFFWIFVV